MTQKSFPWDGDSGAGGTGDCGPYSADTYRDWYRLLFQSSVTTEGVVPVYANKLEVAAGTDNVTVNTGAAIINGTWYENDASLTVSTAHSDSDILYYRIVVQQLNASNVTRVVAIGGTTSAPTVTQTDGTKWEISLALVTLAAGNSTPTVTDERVYLHFNTLVATANIDDSAVTAAKIANRTRTMFLSGARGAYGDDAASMGGNVGYWGMPDASTSTITDTFYVPADFVSTMTVKPLVQCAASGNLVCGASLWAGAIGQSWTNHEQTSGSLTEALAKNVLAISASQAAASVAASDIVTVQYSRYGASTADSMSATVTFHGWLVSYTADS